MAIAVESHQVAILVPAAYGTGERRAGDGTFQRISVATVSQRDEEDQRHCSCCNSINDSNNNGVSRVEAKALDEDDHDRHSPMATALSFMATIVVPLL